MNAFNSLSKRERSIAIAVIVVVAAVIVYQFLLVPYLKERQTVADNRAHVSEQLADAERLFKRQEGLKKVWMEIKSGGLKSSRGQAESQAQQAVLEWAKSAGVNVASLKPERDVTQNQFQVISFHVTGYGSMQSISTLLWSLETATIPVRVNDLQITPRKEGTDDLTLQISVSTLCLPPDSTNKPAVSMADAWRSQR